MNKISILEDEVKLLRSVANDQSIKKIFEQISIILLQGVSDNQYSNVFNEQQRHLLRTLFGHQVQNVM
jgi:hypothetical protein